MWLLNVKTLRLEHFPSAVTTHYAILSHTWGKKELNFQDINRFDDAQLRMFNTLRESPTLFHISDGYGKLLNCCRVAAQEGYGYTWIDTMCINKESSQELSQSINSMYRWYECSGVCYVHLEDLWTVPEDVKKPHESKSWVDELYKCKWFTRGWTLQELIAPSKVQFYNANWEFVGNKEDLVDILVDITGIEPVVLSVEGAYKTEVLRQCTAASKMSWAAHRETTWIEDQAYSLLGLFNINMPLLYGEGTQAFRRLQENIISTTTDHSILLWTAETLPTRTFALSPKSFTHCDKVVRWGQDAPFKPDFSVTNNGIRMTCAVWEETEDTLHAVLLCKYEDDFRGPILFPLRRLEHSSIDGDYLVVKNVKPALVENFGHAAASITTPKSRFNVADMDHGQFERKRLLLIEDQRPPEITNSSFGQESRMNIIFSFSPEFTEAFQLVASIPRGKFNPTTKTLAWNNAGRLIDKPTSGSMTWSREDGTSVRLDLAEEISSSSSAADRTPFSSSAAFPGTFSSGVFRPPSYLTMAVTEVPHVEADMTPGARMAEARSHTNNGGGAYTGGRVNPECCELPLDIGIVEFRLEKTVLMDERVYLLGITLHSYASMCATPDTMDEEETEDSSRVSEPVYRENQFSRADFDMQFLRDKTI